MSIRRFFRRSRWDDERARELESYLACEADDNIARGMSPDAARASARRKLGNVTRIREDIYDMNTVRVLEAARQDLRDAWRRLRRRPAVTVLAVLLLTIGIGASSAALSITYGVLLRPLPYPDADRLVVVWQETHGRRTQLSYPDFADIRAAAPFETMAVLGSGRGTLSAGIDADRVNAVQADPALLPLLGARPLVGRLIDAQDTGRSVAVLSHRLWQSIFHGDPAVVGRAFVLSGTPCTVVGVAAAGLDFELPVGGGSVGTGFTVKDVDLWMPFNARDDMARNRAVSTYEAVATLRPSQTLDQAQQALDVIAANLARAYPETNRNRRFRVVALHDQIVGAKSPPVLIGGAGALLMLIVAFANLTSLFLGELPARRHDLALREALGASRARLVRQIAVESALLSVAGGAAGLVLARVAVESLKAAADLPRLDAIRFDVPVTACAMIAALVTGVVSRVLPLARLRPAHESLRPSISSHAASAPRLRRTLVGVQLALAVVLSATAALLGVSLWQVLRVDPGFAASHALSVRVSAYPARYPQKPDVIRFFYQAVARVASTVGIERVAASSAVPLTGTSVGTSVGIEGRLTTMAERPSAGWQTVTPGYFTALGIRIVKGRDFAPQDLDQPGHRTIINETLARLLFGDADPIGRRLTFGADEPVTDWHEVIAVAGDVRHGSLTDPPTARAYDLFGQHWSRTMYVVSRTPMEPSAIAQSVRGSLHQLDPEAPVFEIQSLDDIVNGAVSPRRLATGFAIGIAGVSLLLAAIGLYGLLASSVAARTKELGIRRALGASTQGIVGLVVGEAAGLAVAGAVAGLVASVAASRWLEAQLVGVHAGDARVVIAIAGTLVVAAGAAVLAPARRAAGVEPAVALRQD